MSQNCQRCATNKTSLTAAEDEVRRIARQMARTTQPQRMSALKDALAIAKARRMQAREQIELGHDCDTRLSDEHWTRRHA